jgi:glycosyltransferase involved in cell wall biosynthesis
MATLCLYYVPDPERDRWLPGDRYWRPFVRRLVRGRPRPSGIDKVFLNLRAGLDRLGVSYSVNKPFGRLRPSDMVGVLGRGRHCLAGYRASNPIVAGVALMTHPSEWPTLLEEYPVVRYLQHSAWAADVYRPYFGDRCTIWPVGIDTDAWRPAPDASKTTDFLVYVKFLWEREEKERTILAPVLAALNARGLSHRLLRYGSYSPAEYGAALRESRAMVFLSEHESQGLAYQEAMASGVPILAWDQGECRDPNRFRWGQTYIPATSVPYWSDECGVVFNRVEEFDQRLDDFLRAAAAGRFSPREYVVTNLTLEICAARYMEIVRSAQTEPAVPPRRHVSPLAP